MSPRREDAQIAVDLVGRACLRERICRSCRQPLVLHADNGNAMRAATLEVRLEELGVPRSFSRPRVLNGNPYSESLFRAVKYLPDYPKRPFTSKAEAREWVVSFVDCYNHQHRRSGIKFVTPHQSHSGHAVELCRHRAHVYAKARQNIRVDGADPPAAGASQRWCGSTSHQRSRSRHWRYHWLRPLEEQPKCDNFPESHRA